MLKLAESFVNVASWCILRPEMFAFTKIGFGAACSSQEDGRFMGEIAQRQLLVNRRSVLPLEED